MITGASRGIGAAVARSSMTGEQPRSLFAKRQRLGLERAVAPPATYATSTPPGALRCDRRRFGGIDIVVPNAGVGAYGPFPDSPGAPRRDDRRQPERDPLHRPGSTATHAGREGDSSRWPRRRAGAGFHTRPSTAVEVRSGRLHARARPRAARTRHSLHNVCPGGVATDFALEEGRGRTRDALAGMMCAEDVADVVLFVLEGPRHLRILETALRPLSEDSWGYRRRSSWGILSTAHINRLVIPGAQASEKVDLLERREPRPVAGRGVRAALAHPPRVRLVRGAAHRPRGRGGVHLAAEHPPLRVVDPRPGGRQARALREAAVAPGRPRSRPPSTRPSAPAASSRRRSCTAITRRRARLAALLAAGAIGELRLVRATFSYSLYDADNIRLRTDVEGGSLMDVGCYCVSGSRLLAGEPESVFGRAWIGPRPAPTGSSRARSRFPGDVLGLFDCGTATRPSATSSRRSGARARSFLDDPWHCRTAGDRAPRARDRVERIELEPVDSYRLELENLSDAIRGSAELLLGRQDATAQARTIAALFDSQQTGEPVSLGAVPTSEGR